MTKQRLTITLGRDVVANVDQIIDHAKIRNRSHAIEFLLNQVLKPKVTQAVILAGGQGVAMRPFSYELPKALIPVAGRPLIIYTIELLREANIRDIIIATGHLGERIKNALGDGHKFGVKITYSQEKKAQGTGGALKNAAKLLLKKPFLVINGDILVKINITELINFHQKDRYLATLALSVIDDPSGYGTVLLQGEKVVKFQKPESHENSHLVNAGIYIINPEVLQLIAPKKIANLDDVFFKLVGQKKLAGFPFQGDWFEVSTPKNYDRAIRGWKQ